MPALNNIKKNHAIDPSKMYNRIFELPEQMSDALTIGNNWNVNAEDFSNIKNIVVIGMGGSAIGGDLVRTLLASRLTIPFQVCRHYVLPEYVNNETLVIASSYSGNTEETLAALDDALHRKAKIAAITTGGVLLDIAKRENIPAAILPTGWQPRAAIGFSFVPLMVFFEKIGMIKNVVNEIEEDITFLKKTRDKYIENVAYNENPAKSLAEKIHGKISIIYSGPTLTDAVALRWKGQICENSKNLAFANHFAEFNHNELVGWSKTTEQHKEHLLVIILHDRDDHPQITKRMNIVKGLIEKTGVEVIDVDSVGSTPVVRMFSLIQLGDFVSYYLAVLNDVDPTPVEVIEALKKMLAKP